MIPKKSTPIKNEVLIDIFAKGLLNKEEMRIVFYIIRWSWGFDGVKRRQDWTKELTKRKIANGIGMHESHLNENINRMITEKKIIVENKCYQFNEHYKEWKNLPKREVSNNAKLTEKGSNISLKGNINLPKREVKLTEKGIPVPLKSLQDKPLPDRKETLKDTYKETLKGNNLFNNKLIRGKKKLSDEEIEKNKENITKSKERFLDIVKDKEKEG